MSDEHAKMAERVRLITIAWGERYIHRLLDYALPAVLAPGNLPALCDRFDCELVIVTSEDWFERLCSHPTYQCIFRYCPVELRPIDEFVDRPDAYGMALTFALFRGFEELGAAMLDTYLVFFNADFIMADGSLRSLARKILAGERLILSPSYCVVLEEVAPRLAARRAPETGVLSITAREMAALALRHRHNTIRGKTVNQRIFSMEWIDQFYWLVDSRTLIGHQLPIAVVCMRPTRQLTEMRTFWDYGIISEACPGVDPCVFGDSDDFLMIELRHRDTAREQISLGWPTPREIAKKLQTFITRDPISLARHTLLLHSDELPPEIEGAKSALDAYVEAVLHELPSDLADHVNHPIWAYHYPRFQQARREYLARRGLGARLPLDPQIAAPAAAGTAPALPAAAAVPLDQRRPLLANLALRTYRRVFGVSPYLRPWHPRWGDVQPVLQALAGAPSGARILVVSSEELPETLFRSISVERARVHEIIGIPAGDQHRDAPPPETARHLFRIEIEDDLPAMIATAADQAPRAIRLRSLQLVWEEAEAAATKSQPLSDTETGPTMAFRDQTAQLVTVLPEPDPGRQLADPLGSADPDEPSVTQEFDFCVCEVNAPDLLRLRPLIRSLTPRLRPGGAIFVFHLVRSMAEFGNAQTLIHNDALALDLPCRLQFTGSERAMQAIRGFARAAGNLRSGRPIAIFRGAIQLGTSMFRAWRANWFPPAREGRLPSVMTSFIIEISVPRQAAGTARFSASREDLLQPAK
jgi:hypothetical protein